jgi:mono/diheme cytochrome c family protein
VNQRVVAEAVIKAVFTRAAFLFVLLSAGVDGFAAPQPEQRAGRQAAATENLGYTPEEDASYERGSNAYYQLCHVCHGEDGTGAPIIDDPNGRSLAPSLSGSRRVLSRPEYVITALLAGVTGPIDEVSYQSLMVSMASYGDAWIADVASCIRNSFDNQATMITPQQVARVRKRLDGRTDPFTVEEILSMLPVPLTNQTSWKVTASHNPSAATNAIKPRGPNIWTSGSPQTAGMWFQLELPSPISLWDLNFAAPLPDSGTTVGFPRAFKIQISTDGSNWSESITEGRGRGPYTLISVGPAEARFIRITLTSTPPDAPIWAISRTQVLQEGRLPSTFAPRTVLNPFE